VLKGYNTEKQYPLVPLLCAEGINAKDIRKEMFRVYGGKILSLEEVHSFIEKFSQ
jgi:hypothetical protein